LYSSFMMSRRRSRHNNTTASTPTAPVDTVDDITLVPPIIPPPTALPLTPDMSVGAQLIRARTARDEHIGTIADYLRIKPEYLYAFEQGQHNQLPALTYALGFLRSYADYLGLDGHAMRDAFRQEMMGRLTPQLSMPQPLPEAKVPPVSIMIGALIFAICIIVGWSMTSGHDHTQITPLQPPVVQTPLPITPAPQPLAIPSPAQEPTAPNTPIIQAMPLPLPGPIEQHFGQLEKPTRLIIRADSEVWLAITDTHDKPIFSQMMGGGDTYHVPDEAGLKLTVSNADAIQLSADGKALLKLGKNGQVLRDIPLDQIGK
jgi:cytoskeleton protein RodZ